MWDIWNIVDKKIDMLWKTLFIFPCLIFYKFLEDITLKTHKNSIGLSLEIKSPFVIYLTKNLIFWDLTPLFTVFNRLLKFT